MPFRSAAAALALALVTLLSGCAGPVQQPVNLAADYFSSNKAKTGRIGVVMSELPKPDTQFPGAGCLLCLAVANGAHSAMSKEVQAFSTDELKPLPAALVDALKKQGLDAVLISEPLKVADLPDLGAANDQLLQQELATCIKPLALQLPPIYRDTLLAADFDGRTLRSIAAEQGLSVSAVKSRASRARSMLRDELLRCCLVEMSNGVITDYHRRTSDQCGGACS